MKLKVVVVDLEIPPRVRRWALRLGVPALILGAASAAVAGTLKSWNAGDVLTAADLNANFAALQTRLAALEAHGGQVVWKDANGAVIPVVGWDLEYGTLYVLDASHRLWATNTTSGTLATVTYGQTIYYSSSGCSGTAYIIGLTPGAVFSVTGDSALHVMPPGATLGSINYQSYFQGSCNTGQTYSSGNLTAAIALAATVPSPALVAPSAPYFTAPAHPEFVSP